ncbi:MAG: hypothetical protein R3B55_02015 [Candidatus Paceibacterota bacterium]
MEMGVFYTPRPVVQFIVRAVDEILKVRTRKEGSPTRENKVKEKKMYVAQS